LPSDFPFFVFRFSLLGFWPFGFWLVIYQLLRKLFFLRDPEAAHDSVLRFLEHAQTSAAGRALLRTMGGYSPVRPVQAMGLQFRNPLGVAAGFDKDARVVLALQELGFACVEVGTVTPRPQPGNPRPRIWRFPEADALVNALGFPGEGMLRVGERLTALRAGGHLRIPIGINLGKNADTSLDKAADDYTAVFEHLHDLGDYFVVNISSPNTVGLRNLQAVSTLRPLLERMSNINQSHGSKPLLVKIAPDLADEDLIAVTRLVRELKLAGIVAGNTTVQRSLVPHAASLERGGLSGAPQFPRTERLLHLVRSELSADQTLIAAGGINSPRRLQDCLDLGANLVQVYTAFIYLGPRTANHLLTEPH
jgi:dihydroorotate dehydrogenase